MLRLLLRRPSEAGRKLGSDWRAAMAIAWGLSVLSVAAANATAEIRALQRAQYEALYTKALGPSAEAPADIVGIMFLSALLTPIFLWLASLLLAAFARLALGLDNARQKALVLVSHAAIVTSAIAVIAGIVVTTTRRLGFSFSLADLLDISASDGRAHTVATAINVANLWWVFAVGLALAAAADRPKLQGIAVAASFGTFFVLLGLLGS